MQGGCVGAGVLLQVKQDEIHLRRSRVNNASISLQAYEMLKHCTAVYNMRSYNSAM